MENYNSSVVSEILTDKHNTLVLLLRYLWIFYHSFCMRVHFDSTYFYIHIVCGKVNKVILSCKEKLMIICGLKLFVKNLDTFKIKE